MIHHAVLSNNGFCCGGCGFAFDPDFYTQKNYEECTFVGDPEDKVLERIIQSKAFVKNEFCTDIVYEEFIEFTVESYVINSYLSHRMFDRNPKNPQVNRLKPFNSEK